MIVHETAQVVRRLQDEWVGREVRITKTEQTAPIQFTLGDAQMLAWREVPEPVREKLPQETQFMTLAGQGDQLYTVLIPVDNETVFDIREDRLVMITDDEVVQVNPVG